MLFFVQERLKNWTEEKLYLKNEDYFSELLGAIDAAQKSIEAEIYIFKFDEVGMAIIEALKSASARGVRIRLLVDTVGSLASGSRLEKDLKDLKGLELRFYHRFWGPHVLPSFARFNRRNHRKTWIFDEDRFFVGSANIALLDWKDISVSLRGGDLAPLLRSFEVAWQKPSLRPSKGRRAAMKKLLRFRREGGDDDLIHLNDTARRRRSLRSENRKRLLRATERIWLANPYFAPPPSFIRTLCKMARKGIDVRVLAPNQSDVFFMPFVTYGYCRRLLKAGVKLYAYLPHVYHAKVRIVDQHFVLGSSNLDYRSVLYNLEVDVKITHKETQKLLDDDLKNDYENNSILVTREMIDQVSWPTKFLARIFSWLRYWI